VGFLGGCTQKKPTGFFWVRTQVSEPWTEVCSTLAFYGLIVSSSPCYWMKQTHEYCRTIHDVKATDIGGRSVRFKAEVDFDGREITRYYLEQQDLEKMLQVGSSINLSINH